MFDKTFTMNFVCCSSLHQVQVFFSADRLLPSTDEAYFFGAGGAIGWPISLPRSFMPRTRSILPRMMLFGIPLKERESIIDSRRLANDEALAYLPASQSLTICGFSLILVARSFWLSPFAWRPCWMQRATLLSMFLCFNSSVSRSSFAVFRVGKCCLLVPALTKI